MNKRFLKVLAFLFLVFMLAMPTGVFAAKGGGGGKPIKDNPPAEPTQQIVYTALGDSIATGDYAFGKDISYAERYRDTLSSSYLVDFVNLAVSGDDSSDMLGLLGVADVQSRIQSSDIITISIGGNNIMPCRGFNFSSIDQACSEAGVAQFQNDWSLIVSEINRLNPDVTIYVNNVYNPYRGNESIFAAADVYIQQINGIISSGSGPYSVVDVYSAFYGKSGSTWNVCTYTYFCNWIRDPHPTDAGHRKIAELHPVPIYQEE